MSGRPFLALIFDIYADTYAIKKAGVMSCLGILLQGGAV